MNQTLAINQNFCVSYAVTVCHFIQSSVISSIITSYSIPTLYQCSHSSTTQCDSQYVPCPSSTSFNYLIKLWQCKQLSCSLCSLSSPHFAQMHSTVSTCKQSSTHTDLKCTDTWMSFTEVRTKFCLLLLKCDDKCLQWGVTILLQISTTQHT